MKEWIFLFIGPEVGFLSCGGDKHPEGGADGRKECGVVVCLFGIKFFDFGDENGDDDGDDGDDGDEEEEDDDDDDEEGLLHWLI